MRLYGELKSKYGIAGMDYYNKEPNFEPFEDQNLGHVEIEHFSDHRTGTEGTYCTATESVAERLGWTVAEVKNYMDENGLTWHECADRRTIRAIPTEINAAFAHTRGIGIEKSMRAAAAAFDDHWME